MPQECDGDGIDSRLRWNEFEIVPLNTAEKFHQLGYMPLGVTVMDRDIVKMYLAVGGIVSDAA